MGEIYTKEKKCVTCETYEYNNIVNVTKAHDLCKKCPDHAVCLGSHLLGPKKGYWKLNNQTDKIFKCPNKDACLGYGNKTHFHHSGTCSGKFSGNLCDGCVRGYEKD